MNDDVIVTTFVVLDELVSRSGRRLHPLAQVGDAEVLTVAVVAAASFQNHHARALPGMPGRHDRSGRLSVSRFNRRLHARAAWLEGLRDWLGELFAPGEVFLRDSLPVPVCRRIRARRCRQVRGRADCGDCAAKREKFFGWRVHLVTTATGVPVAVSLLPASRHDLTPVHERTFGLPTNAGAYGDKAFNSQRDEASSLAETGGRLGPIRTATMRPNLWADTLVLREHRKRIETTTSHLDAMGRQRLRARTNAGLALKIHASLFALTVINAF